MVKKKGTTINELPADGLSLNVLIQMAEEQKIEVKDGDDRDTILAKLAN